MATLDDLSASIITVLSGILFPGTNYMPGAIGNIVAPWQGHQGAASLTLPAKLYRGSPTVAWENAEITAGRTGLSVSNVPGMNRNSTRFAVHYSKVSSQVPTLAVAWDATSVTFGGICAAGQVVGITANKVCYAYRTATTDSPASVAAALAAQIPGATAAGAVLTGSAITSVKVVCDQIGLLHTGQQKQMIQIAAMVPNVSGVGGGLARAAVVRAVSGLKSMQRDNGTITKFIGMPDGSSAEVLFVKENADDTPRNQNVWRQWFYFLCEYDETIPVFQPVMITTSVLMRTGTDTLVWCTDAPSVANVLTDGMGNVLADAGGTVLGSF